MSPTFSIGFHWMRDAIVVVSKRPVFFFAFAMSWLAINVLLSQIPVVGSVFPLMLTPLMAPTYLMTCLAAERKETPQASMLFAAFKGGMNNGHLPGLLMIGVFNTLWTLLSVLASRLVDNGMLWSVVTSQTPFSTLKPEQMEQLAGGILMTAAVYFIGYWIQWFAPALVFWKKMPPAKALGVSMFAVLRYWKSVLGYIVAATLLTIMVTVAIKLLSDLMTPALGALLNILYLTAMLIFFQAATYISYKQVFSRESEFDMDDADIR